MATVFITGATGFIGGHMVRRLCAQGDSVRVLVRPNTCHDSLKSLPVDIFKGDLSKVSVIRQAMKGCDLVYHAAADYRLWTRKPSEMYAANVEGTRIMMEAAWDLGVPKVVYTSTVGTIGLNKSGEAADERTFMKLDSKTGHYKASKFLAEQEVLGFVARGLPVVIVNPSAPVGSQDWKPTPTGRMIVDFLNRRMPMYLDTGLNLVDVEDVVEGHFLAAAKGRIGERYILGNEDLSLKQILMILAQITGLKAPQIRCPYPVAWMAAIGSEAMTRILGHKEPRVPMEGVNMARKFMFFSSQKAQEELGFNPGTVQLALEKAVHWFFVNGYVKKALPEAYQLSMAGKAWGSPQSSFRVDERVPVMAE